MADVCSIYLYDDDLNELVLRATQGLNAEHVGAIRLKLGEGLVGYSLEALEPVCDAHASANPHFRYFAELAEERYESFLAVPIYRMAERIGAAQRRKKLLQITPAEISKKSHNQLQRPWMTPGKIPAARSGWPTNR